MNALTAPFKNIVDQLRGLLRPDPVRHWHLLLGVFAVALIGTVVWNVLSFQSLIEEDIGAPSATNHKPALNKAAIESVRKIFEQRAVEEKKYVDGTYHYSDPSQ